MRSNHQNIVDRDALIDDLANMIRIPSINPFGKKICDAPPEKAMAEYLEERMQELGLEIERQIVSDGRENIWGRLKGSGNGPTIMLAGHMDTVEVDGYEMPFEPMIEDGKIFGRGSCDMKAGLAAYLETIRIIKASGKTLPGDIIIAGVVDEEYAMIGSKHFGLNGPKIDYAIVAEPSNLAICPTHKGQVCLTIKTKGVSVHSSVPQLGVNAIFHMTLILNELGELADELQSHKPDPMCGKPSLSVGIIKGGNNVSAVPDWCEIAVDRRTIPGESYESVLAEYTSILEKIAKSTPNFEYEISEPELNVDPFHTPQDSPIVLAVKKACEDIIGNKSNIAAFTGSTDAPNFKCPAVICGAGALAQCHSLNEYVEIDEIVRAVEIYVNTIHLMQNNIT